VLPGLPAETAIQGGLGAAAIQGNLTPETAKQIVDLWLTAKKAAMGSTYNTDQLGQVLAEPKLSEWQKNAVDAKNNNWYKEYTHAIDIMGVEIAPGDPNQAKIRAKVNEHSKYYLGAQLNSSQEDDLSLVYSLVRQDNQWRIKDWSTSP
jgi:ARC6-like, IMS domain